MKLRGIALYIRTPGEKTMNQLTQSKCTACRKGEPTVTAEEMDEFRPQVPDWNIIEVDGVKRLEKVSNLNTFSKRLTPSTSIMFQSGTCGRNSSISSAVTVGSPLRQAVHFDCVSWFIVFSPGVLIYKAIPLSFIQIIQTFHRHSMFIRRDSVAAQERRAIQRSYHKVSGVSCLLAYLSHMLLQ